MKNTRSTINPPDPAQDEYGPKRDHSHDPPIIWDGHSPIPDGWRLSVPMSKRKDGAKLLGPRRPDPNVTEEWLAAQAASVEAMKYAKAFQESVRRGLVEPQAVDFSAAMETIASPVEVRQAWGIPERLRDGA